ncbi:MAG: hypothetical protein ABW223_08080, partial [Rariglobus sp.]
MTGSLSLCCASGAQAIIGGREILSTSISGYFRNGIAASRQGTKKRAGCGALGEITKVKTSAQL